MKPHQLHASPVRHIDPFCAPCGQQYARVRSRATRPYDKNVLVLERRTPEAGGQHQYILITLEERQGVLTFGSH